MSVDITSRRPSSDRIPREVKAIIASYLPRQAAALAQASRAWQDVAEENIWRSIERRRRSAFSSAGLSVVDAFDQIRQDWVILLAALERRPARQRYVRRIMSCGSVLAVEEITAVFNLCSAQLEDLCQFKWDSFDTHELEESAFALALVVESDWEIDVVNALRSTPNIEILSVESPYSFRDGDESMLDVANPPLHLPRLRTFDIECDGWGVGVRAIVAGAPQLQTLQLLGKLDEDIEMKAQAAEDVFSRDCLRHVQVDGENTSRWLLQETRAGATTLLANVRTLAVAGGVMPERFPKLDHVEFFSIYHGQFMEQTHFIATRPSCQVTGLIGQWFVEVLEGMLRLQVLGIGEALHDAETRPAWSLFTCPDWRLSTSGFQIRTYSDRGRKLYHIRRKHYSSGGCYVRDLLGTHHLAYIHRDLSFYRDRHHHSPIEGRYTADEEGIWVDATSYRGLPIPAVLLSHINASRHETGNWITGERDLHLSEDVWNVLDGWADEVEAAIDWSALSPDDLSEVDYNDPFRGIWSPKEQSYADS